MLKRGKKRRKILSITIRAILSEMVWGLWDAFILKTIGIPFYFSISEPQARNSTWFYKVVQK